ncbi:patatin-like phospholipase family protein [Shewanella sp. AS16]|uniref:patatin-like phospholipase family protein n=1 Tax=Shewanella sp. AS16 TaxID=2907625 RepID=UPI001F23E5F8|nr:patatin-like phospholipase family protein [Shewanella sp. AS16]MCE9687448.1 patatin-like phospholipase family protein [Shewanella sp. AS16]
MSYPFKNLVFEGGGAKGIAYIGAMQVLEKEKIIDQISRVGGTSSGSINAVLLAAGYSNTEMLKILKTLDFSDFKDDSWGVLCDMKRLKNKYGWYKGDYFSDWIGQLLKDKTGSANITFKALAEHSRKELFVYASNLSTTFGEVYSPEHTPRMRVVDAVRRSMSIPLFFQAVRDDREDVFADGGVINNYPVKIFDRKKYLGNKSLERVPSYYEEENKKLMTILPKSSPYIYNKETLGFRLDSVQDIGVFRDGQTPKRAEIEHFLDYTMQLVKTLLSVQDSQHLHSDDWQRTVYINTFGVGTTDFNLTDKVKEMLVKSGKDSTKNYLKWWSDVSNDLAVNHPNSTD